MYPIIRLSESEFLGLTKGMEKCDVVIIGGGAAGCLTAIQIHKNHPEKTIVIVEPDERKMARGVAYGKHFIHQPLNVRVKGMSADPDHAEHFENWLTENQTRYPYFEFDRDSFVARSIYGDYLEEYFKEALEKSNGRISVHVDKVISVSERSHSYRVSTSKKDFQSSCFVLATGNFLPKELPIPTGHLNERHYFSNPWRNDLYEKIGTKQDVFIVGSGLTAVDIILGLHARKHGGKIHLISRNGYLPLTHKHPTKHFFTDPSALLSGNIHRIFSAIREEMKSLKQSDAKWQDVIDSMRAFTAKSWESLDNDHKKIFLKRLKPFWEIHRHRIPERSLTLLKSLKKQDRLHHHKGNLSKIEVSEMKMEIHFRKDNGDIVVPADIVINCTGPDSDFRKQGSELYHQLFSELDLSTDIFHLGLSCTPKGELKKSDGSTLKNSFCIGSLRKGTLWESTAVSDIRIQAKEIASLIGKQSYL